MSQSALSTPPTMSRLPSATMHRIHSTSPPHHHPLQQPQQQQQQQASPRTLYRPQTHQEDEASLSLSDEDMLYCDENDEVWSDAGISSNKGSDDGTKPRGGRSRRLLSMEQSKVLYKILEKTHFPSTQLREAVAAQLGVSPRKVQVWFQNRRQVGKKRMMEAVQTSPPIPLPPHSSTHPTSPLSVLSAQLRATNKGRFSAHEDDRTRAWRKHTIRLALNPSALEEEESKAAIAELERHQQHQQRQGGLRIHVPPSLPPPKTPTYTGPGSASHLETLMRGVPVRREVMPVNRVVSSQKESFSLPHYQGAGGVRGRSATVAAPPLPSTSTATGMREVRGNLIQEWYHKQQQLAYRENERLRPLPPYHPSRPLPPPTQGLRYRSSTDSIPSPKPASHYISASRLPTLVSPSMLRRERYAPYTLPPPPQAPSRPRERTSFEDLTALALGRGRSVSSPHYPHGNQLSESHASSSSTRWAGSATPTPTTAGSSAITSPGSAGRRRQDGEIGEEKLGREGREGKRESTFSPMDVRSLTTANIANVSNGEGSAYDRVD